MIKPFGLVTGLSRLSHNRGPSPVGANVEVIGSRALQLVVSDVKPDIDVDDEPVTSLT